MRAAAALLLMIGFYILAIGVAIGLLFAVYFELMYSHQIFIKPTIFAVVAAGVILWSIVPRPDRFVAPGLLLDEERDPDLFAVIRGVAKKTGQKMPREVYLVSDVNAWVSQRGRFMGIGSRRVMGVGLPLLQTVSVPQFRAIIAHEFGHYHHGDTALGPWIYKTREAIGRTIENLVKSHAGAIHKPFLWYGNFFMRVTQSISRAQELAANALSATVAGARNAINALIATERSGAAYYSYWSTEVVPLLSNGFHPPIAAGLSAYMRSPVVEKQLGEIVDRALTKADVDVYDSHPPLRERIAALEKLPAGEAAVDAPCASTLLRDLTSAEEGLLRATFPEAMAANALRSIAWSDAAENAYVPSWRKRVEEKSGVLRSITLATLPSSIEQTMSIAVRMRFVHMPQNEAFTSVVSILGCALAARLHDQGWSCDTALGMPVTLTKNGRTIEPFRLVDLRARNEISAADWSAACEAMDLGDRALVQ
ncbi:MAG TPA: M48 family metallopeptidase [Thermoanaerobaculia bacterium]|nr:M48 family metallopeptidase [Thermoanaerobaculia bacterium]